MTADSRWFPPNSTISRSKGITPGSGLSRSRQAAPGDASSAPPRARKPIRQVSARGARENRVRAKMPDRRWPDRRDGGVLCFVWEAIQPPWCERLASDLHEIVRRSQGGSITDEDNTVPACRTCNGLLADGPDWGYAIGAIRHGALCCRGRDVCERYAKDGAA